MIAVASHSTAAAIATGQAIASRTPSAVATPLPPRKPSHTGNMWPRITAPAAALWLATAIVFHYSSLAALVGAVAAIVLAAVMVEPSRALLIAGIALLVIVRHHENIRRLLAGTEGRISFGKG